MLSVLLCFVMILFLDGCGGNIENVKIKAVESDMYSTKDVNDAITTITTEFDKEWEGCNLKEIYYAGDEESSDYQDFADRNNADEVIVLLSSFDVDASGGDGSLNPDSTYYDWMWILVRNTGGQWKHVDHGYA